MTTDDTQIKSQERVQQLIALQRHPKAWLVAAVIRQGTVYPTRAQLKRLSKEELSRMVLS